MRACNKGTSALGPRIQERRIFHQKHTANLPVFPESRMGRMLHAHHVGPYHQKLGVPGTRLVGRGVGDERHLPHEDGAGGDCLGGHQVPAHHRVPAHHHAAAALPEKRAYSAQEETKFSGKIMFGNITDKFFLIF